MRFRTFTLVVFLVFGIVLVRLTVPTEAATYATYIYTSSPQLQAELIAGTTNQFKSTISKGATANTYSIMVTSRNVTAPSACNVPDNYVYGFANGMDEERWENLKLVFNLGEADQRNNTCGGQLLSTSTATMKNACLTTYRNMVASFDQRWSYIFTSTGGIVAP